MTEKFPYRVDADTAATWNFLSETVFKHGEYKNNFEDYFTPTLLKYRMDYSSVEETGMYEYFLIENDQDEMNYSTWLLEWS